MSQAKARIIGSPNTQTAKSHLYALQPPASAEWINKKEAVAETTLAFTKDIHDLYDNEMYGHYSLDKQDSFIQVNDDELKWLGYTREEMLGKRLSEILTPASKEALKAEFPNFKQCEGIRDLELELVRKDGSIFPLLLSVMAAGDEDGNYIMSLSTICDISAHKDTEEMSLRRAEQNALRQDVEAALADRDSPLPQTLKRCSEAIVRHLGVAFARIWTLHEEDDMLELQASAGMSTPLDGERVRVPVGTYKIGRITHDRRPYFTNEVQSDPNIIEKEWVRSQGMISFVGYPLIIGNTMVGVMSMFSRQKLGDDTLNALSSISDIMAQAIDRNRIEEALNQTRELLCQAQKMEAIGRLTGGIAHDLNNLLTVIIGCSHLALNNLDEDDPLYKTIHEIEHASNRASEFTSQLLSFSNKHEPQPRMLNLNEVIVDLQKMLNRMIGEDTELITWLYSGLDMVRADPRQIQQIIMNIAINARSVMRQGGKLVIETANVVLDESSIGQRNNVKSGPYVMLAISEGGVEMAQYKQSHRFAPISGDKESQQGIELDLLAVQEIVNQCMGYIEVCGEQGRSRAFKVYIPRANDPNCLKETHTRQTTSEGAETILLVEDDDTVRRFVRSVLQMNGYEVLEAANSDEAFNICNRYEGAIHLMLTDVIMPGMSGQSLAHCFEMLGEQMKVLYMSGYSDDAIARYGILDSTTPFLSKPFTPKALTAKVREVLGA